MSLHRFKSVVARGLVGACCAVALLSCGRSPAAPNGRVQVYVSQDGLGPAPGKTIEVQGVLLQQVTDENGLALFSLRPGTYVVRAYDIGTPGPSRPYVEQSVQVASARTSEAKFNSCTFCRTR